MERTYLGIAHKAKEGGYWLDFPDASGCFTEANTLEDLAKNAKEALGLWIESAIEMGQEIPEPGAAKYQIKRGDVLLGVSVEVADKSVRLNITVPQNVLSRIDSFVKKDSRLNRSAFLVQAAQEYISGRA